LLIQAGADLALSVLVCAAAWWDVTEHRIPNKLTIMGLAAALMLRAPLGFNTLLEGLGGAGIVVVVSGVLYALRAIGGGDVKLLVGVASFMGSREILGALGLIAILGAAFALILVVYRGVLPLTIVNTLDLVRSWRSLGQAGPARKLESPGALTIPYGVPIAVGALIWWFGKGVRL
jgi:prepilin peptidase CpaA